MSEIKQLDLAGFMANLIQDLPPHVQWREHQESDIEFEGHGENVVHLNVRNKLQISYSHIPGD